MAQKGFGGRSSKRGGINPLVIVLGMVLLFAFVFVGVLLAFSGKKEPEVKTVVVEQPVIQQTESKINVLVPVRNISEGTRLEPSLFVLKEFTSSSVPQNSVQRVSALNGMYAKALIVEGSPLISDSITNVKPNSSITAKIPPGFRAVTIRVDATASVEGWVRPGANVDVQWITSESGERVGTVIVENAKVLSSNTVQQQNNAANKSGTIPTTVTLLVPVVDATKINLASSSGRLSLMLRGDVDQGIGEIGNVVKQKNILSTDKNPRKNMDRKNGIIKLRKPNGTFEEFTLDMNGELIPVEK